MKTVAPTKTIDNSAAQRFARSRGPEVHSPIFNPATSSAFHLQRKAACACGGGCPVCQAKGNDLKVSQPNDPAEIEADHIADKVMRMPDNQTLPVENYGSASPGIHRKCSQCEAEEETIQRKAGNAANTGTCSQMSSHVSGALSSGGQALDSQTRAFFEPRFGNDFSNVRTHTDEKAAQSAKAINATAYTLGHDIVFNRNRFRPETETGKSLLAHELAHTIQQTGQINRQESALEPSEWGRSGHTDAEGSAGEAQPTGIWDDIFGKDHRVECAHEWGKCNLTCGRFSRQSQAYERCIKCCETGYSICLDVGAFVTPEGGCARG
jgi:hypothetical protein